LLGFHHARRHLLTAIVLSAVVLRALIPAGFMPGAGGLEFCSGGLMASMPSMSGMPGMPGMSGHHHHHHDGAGVPAKTSGHGEGCVFAGSAAGLAPPCVPVVSVAALPDAIYPVPASVVGSTPSILRAQSPRGPPAFS
jgi:hypothetical protein